MKRLMLAVAVAIAFLVGYGVAAKAWPVYDRDSHYGYFYNVYDPNGEKIWLEGIPTDVDTAQEFIDYVAVRLIWGSPQQHIGAAFIIQTMIGNARDVNPTTAQIDEFIQRVRWAESQGWINWNVPITYRLNSFYQGAGSGPNLVDDAFYEVPTTQTDWGFQFRDGFGNIVYQMRYACANPVGIISPLQDQPTFTIDGHTTVSDSTLYPGQQVTFQHYVHNQGPDGASVWWVTWDMPSETPKDSGIQGLFPGWEWPVGQETFTVPSNAAFGTQYCRRVSWAPQQNGQGVGFGTPVCAQVVPDFDATPLVSTTSTTAQQGDSLTFTYRVQVAGNTRSTAMGCQVAGQTSAPGYTPLPQQDVDRNPKVNPQPAMSCGVEFAQGGPYTVGTETVNVGNAAPGSRICRSLVINPKNQTGGPRSSAEVCVVVAKSPLVQFMGNDVWAGGGFAAVNPGCNAASKIQTTAHTLSGGSVAGSAVEYAGFALGKITLFGSANKALVNPAAINGKTLTFTNFDTNNLGFYGAPQHCINDYVAKYDKAVNDSAAATINVGTQPTGTTLNLSGPRAFTGDMQLGSQQVYLVEGDVTISGNLRYPATYNSLSDIPSLIIIATGNVTVSRNVTQMDGLFVTRGNFYTCDVPVNTTLSVNPPCEQQLVINGAVIAGRLQLLRTFGASGVTDTERKRPAEKFNFNSEMYLRSALSGNNANILQTVDQKDLPPRF